MEDLSQYTEEQAFDWFFEEYFKNTQGEDSPYNYDDVREAFKVAWNWNV